MHSFFVSEDLRKELAKRSEKIMSGATADPATSTLPGSLHQYHTISEEACHVFLRQYQVKDYKATSQADGYIYRLKRIEGLKLLNADTINMFTSTYGQLDHANIIGAKELFTTKAFNDDSIIFVYEYHANCISLSDKFFARHKLEMFPPNIKVVKKQPKYSAHSKPTSLSAMPGFEQLDELAIWSITCQLASALKLIHGSRLACRCLDLDNVLLTGRNRVRIANIGIMEFFDPNPDLVYLQQEDLLAFGMLVLKLASRQLEIVDLNGAMEQVRNSYSPDILHLISLLLSSPSLTKSIDDVIVMSAPRMAQQVDLMQKSIDTLEHEMTKEYENGRVSRLLIKLGFINERPEFEMDSQWSETGDRYLLKLFRDYVFHQVDADGKPVLDLAHVIQNLNLLDAGSTERIMLTSRDDRSYLVVSYQDLKRCAETAFGDLIKSRKNQR